MQRSFVDFFYVRKETKRYMHSLSQFDEKRIINRLEEFLIEILYYYDKRRGAIKACFRPKKLSSETHVFEISIEF